MQTNRTITRFKQSPQVTVCFLEAQMPDGKTWLRATYDEYRTTRQDGTPLTNGERRVLAQTGATIQILDKIDDYIIYGPPVQEDASEDSPSEGGPVDRGTAALEAYASGVVYPEFCVVCNGRCVEADNYYIALGKRAAAGLSR